MSCNCDNVHEKEKYSPIEKVEKIVDWIKDYFSNSKRWDTNAVIGMSGGKDSAVCAALCVRALGPSRVKAVIMPNHTMKEEDM